MSQKRFTYPVFNSCQRSPLRFLHVLPFRSNVCRDLKRQSEDSTDFYRRKRKTEWKRRQKGQTFLDYMIIHVRAGSGGNGCVAFNREKFKPFGPPSGGSGGRGGDVYILPTPHLTTLSSLPKRLRGADGTHGQGSWQNGKAGAPLVIKVPLGTVVRELPRDDPRREKDEYEVEVENLKGHGPEDREKRLRETRWLHYPGTIDRNLERDSFKEAEYAMFEMNEERRKERRLRAEKFIHLDLVKIEDLATPVAAPLGTGHREQLGHLIATGGQGGFGNPHFLSAINRSPKWATKGWPGERVTLSLELKLLADVGLVGMPNAGKSTLLRAITGGRAKSEVAPFAFTTLNPVVGVVRVADDGTFEGCVQGRVVFGEAAVEEQPDGEFADDFPEFENHFLSDTEDRHDSSAPQTEMPSEGLHRPGHDFDIAETFRFTIADNPGLISRAAENVGLGHSFLRSMERSLALVYVVDLSGPAPWDELAVLREELEQYKPGLSLKARMIIANKADLLVGIDHDEVEVSKAKRKLKKLEEYATLNMATEIHDQIQTLDVIPVSAKFGQNLRKVVRLLRKYIEESRGGHDA